MPLSFFHQTTEQRRSLILHGSISKTLIFLSVPSLMLGLVQALMPFMDGLFINNSSGTLVASAVIFCTPVLNMVTALAQGLSVAAMAIIGQLNGEGDFERAKKATIQIIVVGSILGIISAPLLLVAGVFVSQTVHPDISRNVFLYLSLNAIVLPFSFLESIYNGIKCANGKPEASFIRMVLMLVFKTVFNIIFVYWLRLGIVGCVISSLLANLIITAWMFYELFLKPGADRLDLTGFIFDVPVLREIGKLGSPAMLMSFLLNLGFFLINRETEKYGPVVLNAQGIANNISSVCFILPGAFSSAVTTMVSMHVGAGNPGKAKRSCIEGCVLSAIVGVCVVAIVVPLSSQLTILFTREAEVLDIAYKALHIYTYSVVGFGICMTAQGAFIGLGKTKVPLVLSVLRIWFLRYVFILVTEHALQSYSVFWGTLFSNYTAALISIILLSRTEWKSTIVQNDRCEVPFVE